MLPLYDTLNKDLESKDLNMNQKKELSDKLNVIDENGRDIVYTLVRYHHKTSDSKKRDDTLFNCSKKENKNGLYDISWTVNDFPIKLRRILYKFVNLHFESKKEDKIKESAMKKASLT